MTSRKLEFLKLIEQKICNVKNINGKAKNNQLAEIFLF